MVSKDRRNYANVCVQSSQLVKIISSIESGLLWKGIPSTLWLSPFLELVSIFSYRPFPYMQYKSPSCLFKFLSHWARLVFKLVFKAHKRKLLVCLVQYWKYDKVEDQIPFLHKKLNGYSIFERSVYLVSPQKQKLLTD